MNTTSRGGVCNAIFPTLKHRATPNRTYPNYTCRSNPPIYRWEYDTIRPDPDNRFNGLTNTTIKYMEQ